MNYIHHLSAFFEKIHADERLNQSHISIYMALFQFWNLNRFENPFPINRVEVLKLSKVKSLNTYHKCLNELDKFGYIQYLRSFNPIQSSQIAMLDLFIPEDSKEVSDQARLKNNTGVDTGSHTGVYTSISSDNKLPENKESTPHNNTKLDAKSIQLLYEARLKNNTSIHTGIDTSIKPLIKHYKRINYNIEREEKSDTQNLENEKSSLENQKDLSDDPTPERTKRKKVAPKKERVMSLPELSQVIDFFREERSTEFEARKFFNHFESNGWKVGGKTPMKNWQAAARNWILNIKKYSPGFPSAQSNLNTLKNYGEPL